MSVTILIDKVLDSTPFFMRSRPQGWGLRLVILKRYLKAKVPVYFPFFCPQRSSIALGVFPRAPIPCIKGPHSRQFHHFMLVHEIV